MARVLIVDDAMFMRKLLSDIIAAQGHLIVGEASTAKEAVEKFNALTPDLVTMDIVMPQEDGIDTKEAIQKILLKNARAKVLIVSSLGQQAIIEEMLAAGASDFIVKPFQQDAVIRAMNRLIVP